MADPSRSLIDALLGLQQPIPGFAGTPQEQTLEQAYPQAQHALAQMLMAPVHAAQQFTQGHQAEYQPGGSVQDMPQTMQALPEAAMATTMMPGGQGGLGMGIRAYHGSPHDFERFDMSRIGTGEGAQAYGHGLYFAENPKVAQEYRDVLTRRPINDAEILPTTAGNALFDIAEKSGDLIGGKIPFGPSRSLLTREQLVAGFEQGKFSPHDLPAAVQRQIVDQIKPPGRMYEVNINAEPQQFLNWDAPLSQQPETVKDLLAKNLEDMKSRKLGMMPNYMQQFEKGTLSGEQVYRGVKPFGGEVDRASQVLNEAGIPGIRYLDQGSRPDMAGWLLRQQEADALKAKGSPYWEEAQKLADSIKASQTSNYVVFNDKLIDILRKYGIAAPAAGVSTDQLVKGLMAPDVQQ